MSSKKMIQCSIVLWVMAVGATITGAILENATVANTTYLHDDGSLVAEFHSKQLCERVSEAMYETYGKNLNCVSSKPTSSSDGAPVMNKLYSVPGEPFQP